MNKNNSLIGSLARARVVEHLVSNVCHRSAEELGDLVQMVYDILLHKPAREIERVVRNRAVNYYIVGIIQNLYYSKTSPYHRKIRRPEVHDEVTEEHGSTAPDADIDDQCLRAVASLPEADRTLFLQYVEAGGFRELTRRCGIPRSTLRYRIAKIRRTLKKKITNNQ